MYPIYIDGCGEMKMRMLKTSHIFFFFGGGGGRRGATKCAAYVKTILFCKYSTTLKIKPR